MTSRKDTTTQGPGRPGTAHQLRIVPVPHPNPDPRKLGRALLALVLHHAEYDTAQDEDGGAASVVKEAE